MSIRSSGKALLVAIMVATSTALRAQVAGVVTDASTRRGVPGAVVSLLGANDSVMVRTITDDSGRFRLSAGDAQRVRAAKLGYRPTTRGLSPEERSVAIALDRLPNLLEPVRTVDQPKCPRNPTRTPAFALWEQSRAALLGSVIARESNIAEVTRVNFHRTINVRDEEVIRQSVRREKAHALRSFDAALTATEFATRGFAVEHPSHIQFFGPDAEVLLDDAFPLSYCMELASPQRSRPRQVGLRFRPMAERMGRVDLDGTLWVDTSARVLSDIEFRYLGLERWADSRRPGGTVAFREIASGALWIEDWMLRMTGARVRSPVRPAVPDFERPFTLTEGGAALASVRWPDGRTWDAKLGQLEVKLVSGRGLPVAGAAAQLDSTDYVGTTDSTGTLKLTQVYPGPYSVSVADATLALVDTMLPASGRVVAIRDSLVRARVRVPTLAEFIKWGCDEQQGFDERSAQLLIRIQSKSTDKPVPFARWELLRTGVTSELAPAKIANGMVGEEGLLFHCKELEVGKRIIFRVWTLGAESKATEVTITPSERVTAVKVILPP